MKSNLGIIASSVSAAITDYDIEFLVIAGGGSGGEGYNGWGGGGGSGGRRYFAAQNVTVGQSYVCTIGAGGAELDDYGTKGDDSSFDTSGTPITATGGGQGGTGQGAGGKAGKAGGCGGGASESSGGAGNTPSTTPAQGYKGGDASVRTAGGGGIGGAGANTTVEATSSGGDGEEYSQFATINSIDYGDSANPGWFGSGGAGSTAYSSEGVAKKGGGGRGQYHYTNYPASPTILATAGQANTGGGGGAAGYPNSSAKNPGKAGGSGIIFIRYSGAQVGTGGIVVTEGGYTYHIFTGTDTFIA